MGCKALIAAICLPLSASVVGLITSSDSMELHGSGSHTSPPVGNYRGNGGFGGNLDKSDIHQDSDNFVPNGNADNSQTFGDSAHSANFSAVGNSSNFNNSDSHGIHKEHSNDSDSREMHKMHREHREHSKSKHRNDYTLHFPVSQTNTADFVCRNWNGCLPRPVMWHRRHTNIGNSTELEIGVFDLFQWNH